MPKGGETAVRERMRALCQKITVAYDLDPEIQEELFGHMEDRLLGYMSGEDKLTEEDAYILVREHFGDPAALKGLLHEVHDASVRTTLARRLTAALVEPGGFLFLASCSHNVGVLDFAETCKRGLDDAGRTGRILRTSGAGPDHPVHPALPETAYLKGILYQLD
jgi:hypothetical protein